MTNYYLNKIRKLHDIDWRCAKLVLDHIPKCEICMPGMFGKPATTSIEDCPVILGLYREQFQELRAFFAKCRPPKE